MKNTTPAHPNQANFDRIQKADNLGEEITELAAHIHAATFLLLQKIREFDELEGWCRPGLASCAHWLQWQCGTSLGVAREKVRVARALTELPKISQSFSEGRISYSKVRAMTRVATPRNEKYLLCRRHHRLVHEGGFGAGVHADGGIRFTYPDGKELPATFDGRFRGNAESVNATNQANGLEITAATLPSLWRGERMDPDLAQLGMMSRE
jgi:hypothetical protein